MSDSKRNLDSASAVMLSLGLIAGLVQLGYRPFLFGPIAILAMLIGARMSARYKRYSMAVLFLITAGLVIGAAVAVWGSRPLY
jgi:hypothetical protein